MRSNNHVGSEKFALSPKLLYIADMLTLLGKAMQNMPETSARIRMTNDAPADALQSLRRSMVTLGLWVFGVLAILGSFVSVSLQIAVPLLSLENKMWNRPNNPHTVTNVFLSLAIGVTAIVAARSSSRSRFWLGLCVVMAVFACGLYDLGLFHSQP